MERSSRDFTFVENVVSANIKSIEAVLESNSYILNIACGERITLNRLWEIISEVFEISELEPYYMAPRPGDIKNSLADISRAKQVLGYYPKVDVQTGIKFLKN